MAAADVIYRFAHSCVRIERNGKVLVIDPGIWSEPDALWQADAVLITHEHVDHIDELRLGGLGVPVIAPEGAAIELPFTPARPGVTVTIEGFEVSAVGGAHAKVLPDQDGCPNLGYIIDDALYHPGDALFAPGRAVETLLVPMQASWLKTSEGVDFLREVDYTRAFGIHDGQINERAITGINGWYERASDGRYRWLSPGTTA